jgi:GNAT superfamily N-acetyltransferase
VDCVNARVRDSTVGAPSIVRAGPEHADIVADMVAALLTELSGGARQFVATELLSTAHARLEDRSHFFAFIARDHADNVLGVITVTAGVAIYANGIVGTIQELYVAPASRSAAVGASLLRAVVELGQKSGWNRLEVGAPSRAQWRRTIDFYKVNGFGEIGPRLQKRLTME